jgi:hypothetical protein
MGPQITTVLALVEALHSSSCRTLPPDRIIIGGLFLEDDLEIRRYILLFDHLRAAAARPDETVTLLAEIVEELGKGDAG